MRGKRKQILALVLALAMVMQLFVGLGNVAQAETETVTPFEITGRFTTFDAASPVQIGISVNGTITGGANWPNGFLHSGNIQLNGEPQDTEKWRFQATGTSTLNVVCFDYTPQADDVITIPSGTQIRCNGKLYEFINKYSMEYTGSTWIEMEEPDVSFAITGRFTQFDAASPVQIGFSVNGTIAGGGNWPDGFMHSGNIQLNGADQSGWRFQATGTNTLNAVCFDYAPQTDDVITIPAGTQFTCNGKVYEITNEYTIKYDGTTWNEAVKADVSFEITGRYTQFDAASPVQIGFSVNGIIVGGGNWPDGFMHSGNIQLNGADQSGWRFQATGTNTLNAVCFDYAPQTDDVITIPAGTQFTCNGKVYEITNEYKIEYNGTTWVEYVATTPLMLGELLGNSEIANHPSDTGRVLYRVYIATGQTGTTAWGIGDNEVKVYVNGTEEVKSSFVWADAAGQLLVQLDVEKAKNIESITVKKVTQATIDGVLYEVQNDYTVYYYDGGFHTTPYVAPPEPVSLTIIKRFMNFDTQTSGAIPEQIGFEIDGTIPDDEHWKDCSIIQRKVQLNGVDQEGWHIQTTGTKYFSLVCPNYIRNEGDIIKIPAGMQFACNGSIYEITSEYSVKFDGSNWGVYIKADASITISDRFTNFDASATETIPEQIGFAINETITDGDKWIDCNIIYGRILKNGEAQTGWKVQTTGANTFNLVCWNYKPAEKDIITLSVGTQFTCNGKVYEIAEPVNIIYYNGEWVLDSTTISYRGEELVEDALYGVRIGSTKQQIEALFTATDGIGRNLKLTFTYPQEMYDADNKFQAGTYQVKVSATSYSGNTAEYNIVIKGFAKDAPTISYEGETELIADAGKKFDTSSLEAIAKDGNGKKLDIKYKYSDGALNSAGELNKGVHELYLMAIDDEGQSFTRKITLTCYEMTDIVIKGFYLQMEEQLFIATNMKNPEKFKISGIISTDDVLINGKSDVITWITVDEHSGSLYMIIEPKKGDVLTIEGGTTFLDHTNYIGIRTLNAFKGHTDGIGWIKDRLPNNGFGTTTEITGSVSPATGDYTSWITYLGISVLLIPVIVVSYKKRKTVGGVYEK